MAEEPRRGTAALGPASTAQDLEGQQWAIQRRIEDVFAKLGEKFGDLTGRLEVKLRPEMSFDQIGGLAEAKAIIRSFASALTNPELYRNWGITPPKGVLIYGPPGTGKSMLARALATETGAIFYHLKLLNLTSKFGPNTGELLQEILGVAKEQGKGVVFLDEADALSLEHLLPASAGARGERAPGGGALRADRRPRAILAAGRDRVDASNRLHRRLPRAAESARPPRRGDAAGRARAAGDPGPCAHARAETAAGRQLVADIDYRSVLPPMGGMSGAEIAEVLRRALEQKVHAAGQGRDSGLVTTQDLLQQIDAYRRIRVVVEKIRYGQYL